MSLLKDYFSRPIFKPNIYKIITFIVILIFLHLLFIYVWNNLRFGYASAFFISPLLVLYYSLGGFLFYIILDLPHGSGFFTPFYPNWLNFFAYLTWLIIGIGLMFFWYSVSCLIVKFISFIVRSIKSKDDSNKYEGI